MTYLLSKLSKYSVKDHSFNIISITSLNKTFEIPYNNIMLNNLSLFIGNQALFKVIRVIYQSSAPCHLREISRRLSLSASSVSDIIKSLKKIKIVQETKIKNKKYYQLNLSKNEEGWLKLLFEAHQNARISERSLSISKIALERLAWIDQAKEYSEKIKQP